MQREKPQVQLQNCPLLLSEGSLCENTQTIVSFPINESKRASIGLEVVHSQNRSISGGNIHSSILGSPVQLRNEDIW